MTRIKNKQVSLYSEYKLMIIDDDKGLVDSISSFLFRNGYSINGLLNPIEGLEVLKQEKYDLLILDYYMSPIKGDDFVSRLREFDLDLHVILLTGHKDLAPPLDTIRAFDIQAYCEKSHRLDQLLLLIEAGIKSIIQMKRIADLYEELQIAHTNLKDSYLETIEALRLAVDAKDVYTRGHSDRVSMYSLLIGKKLGMGEKELEELRIGGLFHDIGKIGLSDDILFKETKLTENEYQKVKEHPAKGEMIVAAISAFENIKQIIGGHHERFDGRGYPRGLKGEENPLGARIVCIADAYDAITSDRHYRKKFAQTYAFDQLKMNSESQFDGKIVDCFLSIIEENPEEINRIFCCG